MLKYTLKEYKEEFDIKLSEYLSSFEDNTPVSFIDQQKALFTTYNNALLLIADELKKYGELEANNIFLSNTAFDDLKKIASETYDDIRIEEKFKPLIKGFQTLEEFLVDRDSSSENHCTRIDYTKLRNHLNSVGRILEFLSTKYLKYQSEPSKDDENDSPIFIETQEFDIKANVDGNQQIINDHLGPFESYLSSDDYILLSNSLIHYFNSGSFPTLEKKINFKTINKKWIGWALKEIFISISTAKLSYDLLSFAQRNINIFDKEVIDKKHFQDSNLYKSFTEKPKSYKYRQIHLKYLENH
ncbi:hypothetical protein [Aquirufa antheringensis]|uniref:hypothetical protein n=1 Tax=Aquirufa antheringensis TaxID=2516559 RepID=UPI00208FDA59|nr:hypothetical protein [Aquirufa antheringensis]USQ03904.1 hypothetical protein G9X63_07195 [Aquirufa antheringensis]